VVSRFGGFTLVNIQGVAFYSVEETAALLGVTKRTLYNWKSHSGQNGNKRVPILTPVIAPNGRRFFRESEIIAALSQCWGISVTPDDLRNGRILVEA
jgi:hypothetical protein